MMAAVTNTAAAETEAVRVMTLLRRLCDPGRLKPGFLDPSVAKGRVTASDFLHDGVVVPGTDPRQGPQFPRQPTELPGSARWAGLPTGRRPPGARRGYGVAPTAKVQSGTPLCPGGPIRVWVELIQRVAFGEPRMM
jgi:hypothetical protein